MGAKEILERAAKAAPRAQHINETPVNPERINETPLKVRKIVEYDSKLDTW